VRAKILRYLLIVGTLVVVGVIVFSLWMVYYTHAVIRPEAYAVWQTADLVTLYMERHNGEWPRSWEDLRPLADARGKGPHVANREGVEEISFMPRIDIDRLQQLVEVDWSVDARELARMSWRDQEPALRVIWLRSGRRTAFEGCEPNQLIKNYLDGKYRLQDKGAGSFSTWSQPPSEKIKFELRLILLGHEEAVFAIAVAPDSKSLASGGADRTVILWDIVQGKQRHALLGHEDSVESLAFSRDGKILASAGTSDKKVKVWDVSTGKELATYLFSAYRHPRAIRTDCAVRGK
jgi:WD40 repeat protein